MAIPNLKLRVACNGSGARTFDNSINKAVKHVADTLATRILLMMWFRYEAKLVTTKRICQNNFCRMCSLPVDVKSSVTGVRC